MSAVGAWTGGMPRQFRAVCVTLALMPVMTSAVSAQAPAVPATSASPAPVRTAAQQFKNVQVLRDIPAPLMNPTMHLIQGQLGVECQFCHIWEEWDREDKPMKQVARRMLAMTAELNRANFNGNQVVTCYTCHRGSPKPVGVVALPAPKPPSVDHPPPRPVLPRVDQVLAHYVAAIGGEQALRRVSTRHIVATRDIPTGPGGVDPMPSTAEFFQKAPNLTMNVYRTATFAIADGFDGTTAWAKNMAGTIATPPAPDRDRVRRAANFYEPLELKAEYARLAVSGIETVMGRDAYVIMGYLDDDLPERLYFDVESGLLLRKATTLPTAVGLSPFEVDYEDYRAGPSGVRLPWLIRMTPAGPRTEIATSSTVRIQTVEEGVPLSDTLFARPR